MARDPLARVLGYLRRQAMPAAEDADDSLLTRFVGARDASAFESLLHRHGPMVLGVCRRLLRDPHLAEDAFQATFLVLLRKADGLTVHGSLAGWLYTVARRTALRARAQAGCTRSSSEEAAMPESPVSDAERQELRALLEAELERMPEKYRSPLVLCYFEGKTHEEAARQLGWPRGSMAKRLERGQELLRARIARHGLAITAAALATLLAEDATAAVPSALAAATQTAAASDGSAGCSTTGTLLAAGVLKEMLRAQWKLTTVYLLSGIAVIGITAVVLTRGERSLPLNAAGAAPIVPLDDARAKAEGRPFPAGDFAPGFIDAAGRTLYVVNAAGNGIEAIGVEKGDVLWSSKEACYPIALTGGQLLALGPEPDDGKRGTEAERVARLPEFGTGKHRLIAFDVNDNGRVRLRSSAALLTGVPGNLRRVGHGDDDIVRVGVHVFTITPRIDARKVDLEWEASSGPPIPRGSGQPVLVPPPPKPYVMKHWEGKATVDRTSGEFKIVASKEVPAPRIAPREPAPDSIPEALREKLRQMGIRVRVESAAGRRIASTGHRYLVATIFVPNPPPEEGGHYKVVVESWNDEGKLFEPRELCAGSTYEVKMIDGADLVSVYEAVARDHVDPRKSLPAERRYSWLYSLETGKLVGKVPDGSGEVVAVLSDRHLLCKNSYQRPYTAGPEAEVGGPRVDLKLIDYQAGRVIWSRPLYARQRFQPVP